MSPVDNTPPQIRKQPARTDNRLREIERSKVAAQGQVVTATGESFPGYSVPDEVLAGIVMPPWYAQMGPHAYVSARVSAVTAGGGDCEFHLSLNGSTIEVLTLGSGETTHVYVVTFTVNQFDFLGGTIASASGQFNWSMQLEEAAA